MIAGVSANFIPTGGSTQAILRRRDVSVYKTIHRVGIVAGFAQLAVDREVRQGLLKDVGANVEFACGVGKLSGLRAGIVALAAANQQEWRGGGR